MKILLRLIGARPKFYMIGANPIVSVGSVDCSIYKHRIALKVDYHKKGMNVPGYTPVEYNYLETLAKPFINPAGRNWFIRNTI